MTNSIALSLALLIAAIFILDQFVLQLGLPLFLAQQFTALIEWVSFWR